MFKTLVSNVMYSWNLERLDAHNNTVHVQGFSPAVLLFVFRSWHTANTRHKRLPNLHAVHFSKSCTDTVSSTRS
jgi:hypothetical protein